MSGCLKSMKNNLEDLKQPPKQFLKSLVTSLEVSLTRLFRKNCPNVSKMPIKDKKKSKNDNFFKNKKLILEKTKGVTKRKSLLRFDT